MNFKRIKRSDFVELSKTITIKRQFTSMWYKVCVVDELKNINSSWGDRAVSDLTFSKHIFFSLSTVKVSEKSMKFW